MLGDMDDNVLAELLARAHLHPLLEREYAGIIVFE